MSFVLFLSSFYFNLVSIYPSLLLSIPPFSERVRTTFSLYLIFPLKPDFTNFLTVEIDTHIDNRSIDRLKGTYFFSVFLLLKPSLT